jgi:hypothetical protein
LQYLKQKCQIVWNWELIAKQDGNFELLCLGNYNTHRGNPSLLRSDSMLKAIGKSINIRVSSIKASKIPIIIFGNTPISQLYTSKVDHLMNSGIIQGFWSLNSNPLDNGSSLKNSPQNCFIRMDSYPELISHLNSLFTGQSEFFSGMIPKTKLGEIIKLASQESDYLSIAQKFLDLLRGSE